MAGRLFVIAMAGILVGCHAQEDVGLQADFNGVTNLREVVFAAIDDQPLTAADVRDSVLVLAKMSELLGHPISSKRLPSWGNNMAMRIVPEIISSRVIEDEARRCKVHPSSDDEANVRIRYGKRLRRKVETRDELAALFSNCARAFERQFERECLIEAFYRERQAFAVTEEDIAAYMHSVTNQIRRNAEMNEEAKARGLAAWNELENGVPWETVAQKYSEDRLVDADENGEYWKEWMSFRLKDMPMREVQEAVGETPAGGWTRPLDTDEGLMIVKVLKKEDGIFHCARILIRMAVIIEAPTRAEAERGARQEKLDDINKELMPALRARAKITYPLGKRFRYEIWPRPKSPGPGGLRQGKAGKE